jgi:hypothetical protein
VNLLQIAWLPTGACRQQLLLQCLLLLLLQCLLLLLLLLLMLRWLPFAAASPIEVLVSPCCHPDKN